MKLPIKYVAALIAATLRSSGFKTGESLMILSTARQMLRGINDA